MEQQKLNRELDTILAEFGSPFMTAATKLLADPKRCMEVLDDHALYGCADGNVTPQVANKMIGMIDTVTSLSTKLARHLNIDPVVMLTLLMFEAGRSHERETMSIAALEEMFKSPSAI
jgi:hypothetical protein